MAVWHSSSDEWGSCNVCAGGGSAGGGSAGGGLFSRSLSLSLYIYTKLNNLSLSQQLQISWGEEVPLALPNVSKHVLL